MPITFKNQPAPSSNDAAFGRLHAKVRALLQLPSAAKVSVGVSKTTVTLEGVSLTLPFGVAALKNDAAALNDALGALNLLVGGSTPMQPHTPSEGGSHGLVGSDEDEVWMQAVATSLFPGVVPLHKATDLHQQVHGTSKGAVYRVCFIGPKLLGACKIDPGKVAFRFTTPEDKCPEGAARSLLERLGVDNVYSDRMTCHVSIGGGIALHDELRMIFGAFYAGLRPHLNSKFPSIPKLAGQHV